MKKIYALLLLCQWLLFMTACDKFVEVENPTNQLGTTQVFEDMITANAALGYLYATLRDQSVVSGAGFYTMGTLLGSYTDDLDCYYTNSPEFMDIYHNQQLETNTVIKSVWNTAYKQIYYANSIIYGAQNSAVLSEIDKNQLIGEALVIRSLIYMYLQLVFGDIPYTSSTDYEYNRNISKTESSVVMEQLEADIMKAVELLEDNYRDAGRIYINRKTAQLLLARIYLILEEWVMAEQTVGSIIESPLYEFQTNINEVFEKSGNHILWQLMPEVAGYGTLEASYYYFTNAIPNNKYTLTQNLVDSFDPEDLRKQAWMAEVTVNGSTWYRPYKYKNLSDNSNEYSIVFRLEEAYFIMAEALARQNRVEEALPYLNATRERAGLTTYTSLSGEDFINELVAEKRREFFTEFGHRFIDLKRLSRLNDLSAFKPGWEEYKQVWPLPLDEMLLNYNLSPQNSGY
jgi:hypothetical protein